MTFPSFFRAATDGHAPYDYQRRFTCGEHGQTACGEQSRTTGDTAGRTRESRLISIPTGLGK